MKPLQFCGQIRAEYTLKPHPGPYCRSLLGIALVFVAAFVAPGDRLAHSQQTENMYRLGIGDVLEIVTWKEPDFSREEVFVRNDGYISFPLLNDNKASGLTTVDLKKTLEDKLKTYVEAPEITVTVTSPGSQKFYVLGEVENVGEYPLMKNLTVLQAFAMAGGFTEWASKKKIILLRRENGKEKVFEINYKDIVNRKDFSQNVLLKADDTIIVP